MAQPGRAQRSGRWGRWFKSSRPDHFHFIIKKLSLSLFSLSHQKFDHTLKYGQIV